MVRVITRNIVNDYVRIALLYFFYIHVGCVHADRHRGVFIFAAETLHALFNSITLKEREPFMSGITATWNLWL